MKVILKKDIKKLGKAGDVKDVSDGFAKNYLFTNNLAILASGGALKELEIQKASNTKKEEVSKKETEALFKKLNKLKIKVSLKFGEGDKSFGSVSVQNISDKLKEKGFDVGNSNILLENNIKTLGEHPVKVRLDFDFEPEITVVVEKEQ